MPHLASSSFGRSFGRLVNVHVGRLPGKRAGCAGQATPQEGNVQNAGKGTAGQWRRRDVVNAWLPYRVCDVRRTLNRPKRPGRTVGRFECLVHTKNLVLRLSVGENAFGSHPDLHPVTRLLPRNHLSLPVNGRRAWDAAGKLGRTGRSSRWSNAQPGSPGKPCTGGRTRTSQNFKNLLCWKAGCMEAVPVRFGGGRAETRALRRHNTPPFRPILLIL
jgi:hypothetical protein